MKIAGLTVNSTSGQGAVRKDRLVVKRGDQEIARVELRHRRPLQYVRRFPTGKYGRSLRLQLTQAGVDGRSIAAIFGEPDHHRPKQAWFSVIDQKS